MKVAVIGCGAEGARHAAVVVDAGDELVAVVDLHAERAEALGARFRCAGLTEVPPEAEAVVVATPAGSHREVLDRELGAGRWVLCGAPLVLPGERISSPTERLAPAMPERFHPVWDAVNHAELTGITLVRNHRGQDGREDVDVVLDRMIHDLDRVLSWGGKPTALEVQAPGWPHQAQVSLKVGNRDVVLMANRRSELRTLVFTETANGPDTLRDSYSIVPDPRCLSRQWAAFQRFAKGKAFPVSVDHALAVIELAAEVARRAGWS